MNDNKHPSRHNSFYGKSIDPYEVIFHKWRWEESPPVNKDMIDSHIQRLQYLKGACSNVDKFIYVHIRSGDEPRLKSMMDTIQSSGVLEDIVELRYIVVGNNPEKAIDIMQQYSKTKCVQREPSMWTWATATLQRLREDCLSIKDKAFILYLCSPLSLSGWEAMLDGLANYRHLCWHGLLCGADAVGGVVRHYPRLHFHGNFWWSTASHLSSRPPITDATRNPELWLLGSVPNPKYIQMDSFYANQLDPYSPTISEFRFRVTFRGNVTLPKAHIFFSDIVSIRMGIGKIWSDCVLPAPVATMPLTLENLKAVDHHMGMRKMVVFQLKTGYEQYFLENETVEILPARG
jgi:hypothetical protein